MPNTRRRLTPPRPGTFAAWVIAQPATMRPTDVAVLARQEVDADGKKRWPKCTPQAVYNARYHYGLTSRTTVAPSVSVVAERVTAIRARGAAPDVPPELLVAVARFGVDATMRAVGVIQARSEAIGKASS